MTNLINSLVQSFQASGLIVSTSLNILVILRFRDCDSIPEYRSIAENYQRVVEVYGIKEHAGIDHFTTSNLPALFQ